MRRSTHLAVAAAFLALALNTGAAAAESDVSRFDELADRVAKKSGTDTPQDQIVLFSSLLIQDALGEQTFGAKQRAQVAKRLTVMLCEVLPEERCRSAADDIRTIVGLYAQKPADTTEADRSANRLKSAVVTSLSLGPLPAQK